MASFASGSRRHFRAVCIVLAALTSGAAPASAQQPDGPTTDDRARAQQLFEAALADIEKGDIASACPKFLASQKADPKTSTLLNLANCYEKNGQTASAWGAFKEGELTARKIGREDWAKTAADRAKALESRLVRLTVVAPKLKYEGLQIKRDATVLLDGELGVAIPVDPGEHVVAAKAPGYLEYQTKVIVADSSQVVQVPPLEVDPAATKPPPPPLPVADKPPFWSTGRVVGVGTAAVGVALLGVGLVVGITAKSAYDDAKSRCAAGTRGCPADAVTDADSAFDRAGIATGFFVAGGVLAAGGAALFFLWPTPAAKAGVTVVPGPGGLSARGTF